MAHREPAPGPAAEPDSGGVLVDVLGHGFEVPVALEHARLETALEKVSSAVVAAVEPHRMDGVQPLHPSREVGTSRLDQQVEVVVEQIPGVHLPAEPPSDVAEECVPRCPIAVVEHDPALLDATADHVVPGGARQRTARDPRHGRDATAREAAAKPA
jgi:hypothetical protein